MAGLVTVGRSAPLRRMFGALALMSAAQGFFLVLFLLFVREELGSGDSATGLLRGAQAIGGLLGGLVVGALARRYPARALAGWGSVIFGALSLLTWNGPLLTTALGVYAGMFAVAGVPALACQTGLLSEVQTAVPDELRGRVLGCLQAVVDGVQAAGMLAAGALVAHLALAALLDTQAALYLAAGVLILLGRRVAQP